MLVVMGAGCVLTSMEFSFSLIKLSNAGLRLCCCNQLRKGSPTSLYIRNDVEEICS